MRDSCFPCSLKLVLTPRFPGSMCSRLADPGADQPGPTRHRTPSPGSPHETPLLTLRSASLTFRDWEVPAGSACWYPPVQSLASLGHSIVIAMLYGGWRKESQSRCRSNTAPNRSRNLGVGLECSATLSVTLTPRRCCGLGREETAIGPRIESCALGDELCDDEVGTGDWLLRSIDTPRT